MSSGVTGAGYRHGTRAPPAALSWTSACSAFPLGLGLWSYFEPSPQTLPTLSATSLENQAPW